MNAIIMAAGLGSRFKEVTKTKHKALLPIQGVPNLERTIIFLNEAGIKEIHVLIGYLSESFAYLPDKFPGVILHENPEYATYNNIYTFKFGLPFFGDSYVIDADTVFGENIFLIETPTQSTYYTLTREEDGMEWCPVVDEKDRVVEMKITAEKIPAMTGITYWSKKDAAKIKYAIDPYLVEEKLLDSKLYWDNIPVSLFPDLEVTTKELEKDTVFEMDTQENYAFVQKKLKNKKL